MKDFPKLQSPFIRKEFPNFQLRPYQQECIDRIIEEANVNKVLRQAIVMSTGSGKTIIFSSLVPLIKAKGKKTLILCHREELLNQSKEKLLKIDSSLKVEIEQAERVSNNPLVDVVIASVPTLGRKGSKRIEKFNPDDFSLIICDEFHHSVANSWKNVLRYFKVLKNENYDNSKVLLGFTATPHRADHIGLDTLVDKITYNYPLRRGIDEGYLANIKAYTVNTKTDISKVKTRMGDFSDKELEEAVNTEERNKLIIETYQELTPDTKALVFAVDVKHTEDLCSYFQKVGISAKYVIGETDKDERKNIIKEFEKGKIKVLVGCNVFSEGFDCIDSETEILTEKGWIGMNRIKDVNNCYSLNLLNNKIELVSIERKIIRNVKEKERMVLFKNQHYNIRTTEGHNFFIKHRIEGKPSLKWYKSSASNIIEKENLFGLPLSGDCCFENSGVNLTEDQLKLLAWFITDGHREKKGNWLGGFVISQSLKSRYISDIESLLHRLGIDFTYRVKKSKGSFCKDSEIAEYRIPKGTHKGSLKRNGAKFYLPYLDKKLAKELFTMSPMQFTLFWKELLKGDGNGYKRNGEKRAWLSVGQKELVNNLQEVAIRCGFSSTVNTSKTPQGKPFWYLSIREKKILFTQSNKTLKKGNFINYEIPSKDEKVWCVENKNKTIVIRRKGKIAIVGNCPSIETILMARPTKSSVLFAQQVGRGSRITDTKKYVNVVDFVDNIGSNQIITLPSLFGCLKTLKGTKGKLITEIADIVNEMNEVNPEYDYSEVDDWTDEERLDKVIKEIDIFAQAEIPEEVKNNSRYSWEKIGDMFSIKFPPNSNNKKVVLELKPNMLSQYELKIKEYKQVTPNRLNGYTGWAKETEKIHFAVNTIEEAFKQGDDLITKDFSAYTVLFNRDADWRSELPTEKQLNMLRKFKVPIPKGLTKGQCAIILGKKFNEKRKIIIQ